MPLLAFVQHYIEWRDVTPAYASLTAARIKKLFLWCENPALTIAELNADLVNEFLTNLQRGKLSRVTVGNYARVIRAVMHFAYMEGSCDDAGYRIKRIKTPTQIVDAFTLAEVRKILAGAKVLRGYFPNGIRKADFWQGIVHSAYSTGPATRRLADGQTPEHSRGRRFADCSAQDRPYRGRAVQRTKARHFIQRMTIEDDERALPWAYHENAMPRQFRKLVKAAGVRPGQFNWLRRTAGSYGAELRRPGDGPAALGHRSEAVFRKHYEAAHISRRVPVEPPPITNVDITQPRGPASVTPGSLTTNSKGSMR